MPSITVREARDIILSKLKPLPAETVPVAHALGRILSADIASPIDIPAYTNSAMDGFALSAAQTGCERPLSLAIAGEALAGHPFSGTVGAAETIRITTGAAVPDWADAVVPFEKVTEADGRISLPAGCVKPGANIRTQGELLKKGAVALARGRRLTRADIALAASLGLASVSVAQTPVVSLLVTGDELVAPGEPCPEGKIYDANTLSLQTLIESAGGLCQNFGIIPDDPKAMSEALDAAIGTSSLIILSGGAADSKADFSHQLLASRGTIEPWTVNMRPGRPMRFGMLDGVPVFILPGNPVAAFVTFLEFARGALLAMQGASEIWPSEIEAVSECDIKTKPGRAEFARGLVRFEAGRILARPLTNQSSAALTGIAQGNALLAIGHDESIRAGDCVRVQLLASLLG